MAKRANAADLKSASRPIGIVGSTPTPGTKGEVSTQSFTFLSNTIRVVNMPPAGFDTTVAVVPVALVAKF